MNSTEYSFLDHFYASRSNASEVSILEQNQIRGGKKPYINFDSSFSNYEQSFNDVLSVNFETFLSRRQKEKGKVFTLDVMGTGGFTEEYPIDGQVAITLTEFRKKERKCQDLSKNKHVIIGNVLIGNSWRQATQFLEQNDHTALRGFDLAIIRPADAGWRSVNNGQIFDDDDYIHWMEWLLVKKTLSLISPHGGMLLVQYNAGGWIDRLKDKKELDIKRGSILIDGQIISSVVRISTL